MRVINNGKGLALQTSYFEAAILTEALRKGAQSYQSEGASEHAEQVRALLDDMLNNAEAQTG